MVVDRSFVDADGIRWIIDYKTGTHAGGDVAGFLDQEQERYRAQLAGYAAAFSRPGGPARAHRAVLSPGPGRLARSRNLSRFPAVFSDICAGLGRHPGLNIVCVEN